MSVPPPSPAARLLLWLASAVEQHRFWFGWPHLALAALCLFVTAVKPGLQFNTDRNALVGGEKEYHHIFLEFRKEFPVEDDLVVVVESEQMEKNRQFVERLGAKLEAETNLFRHVFYKGDLKMMGRKALLFVSDADLKELEKALQDFRPFLRQFTKATNLVTLFNLVNRQISLARDEENEENQSLVKALPALERIVDQATDALLRVGAPPSPGINALFDGSQQAEKELYITYSDGRIYLVTAQAVSEAKRGEAVERLRQLVSETEVEVPGLNVGITGEPVLEYDEMVQSQKDTTVATVVSLILVALIFIYGYHETGRPL
ncbi:MAG TPA: MMPL family transporter, partial [Candidatus Binatia bacterium]|nr:MMPL family transporter [Candidatus Binatia bacterium]